MSYTCSPMATTASPPATAASVWAQGNVAVPLLLVVGSTAVSVGAELAEGVSALAEALGSGDGPEGLPAC